MNRSQSSLFQFLNFLIFFHSNLNMGFFLAIELHLPNQRSIILLFKKLISFQVRDLLFPFHSSGSQEGRRTRNWFQQSSLPIHEVIFFAQEILLKFIYSEKATQFCKIFLLLLTVCTIEKVRGGFRKILWPSQNIWTSSADINQKSADLLWCKLGDLMRTKD